jgi:hypothetical protein
MGRSFRSSPARTVPCIVAGRDALRAGRSCIASPAKDVLRAGAARGRLMGGNLTVLVHLLGTPYMPSLRGAVLFLEETGEEAYRVDRLPQSPAQLRRARGIEGRLRGAALRARHQARVSRAIARSTTCSGTTSTRSAFPWCAACRPATARASGRFPWAAPRHSTRRRARSSSTEPGASPHARALSRAAADPHRPAYDGTGYEAGRSSRALHRQGSWRKPSLGCTGRAGEGPRRGAHRLRRPRPGAGRRRRRG